MRFNGFIHSFINCPPHLSSPPLFGWLPLCIFRGCSGSRCGFKRGILQSASQGLGKGPERQDSSHARLGPARLSSAPSRLPPPQQCKKGNCLSQLVKIMRLITPDLLEWKAASHATKEQMKDLQPIRAGEQACRPAESSGLMCCRSPKEPPSSHPKAGWAAPALRTMGAGQWGRGRAGRRASETQEVSSANFGEQLRPPKWVTA